MVWAAAITGAVALGGSLVAANTSTATTGNTATNGNVTTQTATAADVNSTNTTHAETDTDQLVKNFVDTITKSNSATTTSTAASADPDVIASLKGLAATALANSSDPTKTQGLISGILQSAGDAMTGIFGTQKNAGIYNGTTAANQTGDTNARATADAASAVLGYTTNEQTIASDALTKLLAATATSTTNSATSLDTDQQVTSAQQTLGKSVTDSVQNIDTLTTGEGVTSQTTNQEQKTTGTSSKSMSIVCTWMYQNGYLKRADYIKSIRHFEAKGDWTHYGYAKFSAPLVRELERDRTSLASRCILNVFSARTSYVAGRKSIPSALATFLVFLGCCPAGLYKAVVDLLDSGCYAE